MKYLIIGASSGLGRELIYKFAEEKNNLVIVSRDSRDLMSLKSDLEIKFNISVDYVALDFSSLSEIDNKLFSKKELLKNLQGVLYPIGMMFDKDNQNLDVDSANKLINSNYLSIVYSIQKLSKYLTNNGKASITGFGSVSSYLGREINIVYAGAKRALESYFESLAFEKDYKEINIQFYTLGYLDTNLSFGKNLKLPKGSIQKLAMRVYDNRNVKFKRVIYPKYWMLILFVLKLLPFSFIIRFYKLLNR